MDFLACAGTLRVASRREGRLLGDRRPDVDGRSKLPDLLLQLSPLLHQLTHATSHQLVCGIGDTILSLKFFWHVG